MKDHFKQKFKTPPRFGAPAFLLTVALITLSATFAWGQGRRHRDASTNAPSSGVATNATSQVSTNAASEGGAIYLNHDLSTGDLSQWIYQDYGLGTDVGSNASGAGYLWYHDNVSGQRAAGLTATGTAQASPSAGSDSVFLWDPTEPWNYAPTEFWLRTSFMFPSQTTISAVGEPDEGPYQPTTGDWNWFLVLHNDSTPEPSCSQEMPNVALEVKTDDHAVTGAVGKQNVRLAARVMGGNDCSPNIVWINGPPLVWDHWYQMLLHVKLDPYSGIFEWYIDDSSTPYYSNLNFPTLYSRPSGNVSPSYTSLTAANYRFHAPWSSTIYLGPLVVGSSENVVLNAF